MFRRGAARRIVAADIYGVIGAGAEYYFSFFGQSAPGPTPLPGLAGAKFCRAETGGC